MVRGGWWWKSGATQEGRRALRLLVTTRERTCVWCLHASSHSAFRIFGQFMGATAGCARMTTLLLYSKTNPVLIREGFPLAYSLLPSVGNVGRCMGGDAAKAATRSVRRQLELTEMTSETSLLAAHLRPYSTASSSGILGASS